MKGKAPKRARRSVNTYNEMRIAIVSLWLFGLFWAATADPDRVMKALRKISETAKLPVDNPVSSE